MGLVKRGGIAVQDGDQIDHGVVPGNGLGQGVRVMHIHLQHGQARQQLNPLRIG